jgi:hypothetical protein
MASTSVTGSCFCEAVQFEIELPTLFCGHCHCSMCRQFHGASFVTWTGVPPDRLKFTSGKQYITRFQSSEQGTRSFCKICGSPLFCEIAGHEVIDIALASLHGRIDRDPAGHVYFDVRADWTVVNDDLPKYGGKSGKEPL